MLLLSSSFVCIARANNKYNQEKEKTGEKMVKALKVVVLLLAVCLCCVVVKAHPGEGDHDHHHQHSHDEHAPTNTAAVTSTTKPKFEFEDVGRKVAREKYKHLPNPPIYESPLGACEVPDLSFKRVKKELKKRMVECPGCTTKADYQVRLRDAINDMTPVMSDEDYERYLIFEADQAAAGAATAATEEPRKEEL